MYATVILGIVLLQVSCGDWIINLEYSLDDWDNVSPLGKITLRPFFDGNFSGSFLLDTKSVNLGSQLRKSTSSIYRMRATSNDELKSNFTTFTKPCMMMKAKLMHLFWVAVDSEKQTITSLTVFPDNVFAGSNLNSEKIECSELSVENITPHGTVHVHSMRHLPVPDTQTFVDKIERERKARADGGEGGQDNRSFLAKYWMYIAPVVIFMLISSAMATRRDYPSIKEYAEAQRELGSCLPQFRGTMVKATQTGACFGVAFGLYVAWRQQQIFKVRSIKPFVAQTFATWGVTFMAFTCMGLMAGTYNCLRVKF